MIFGFVQDTLAVIADSNGNAARPPLNLPSRPILLSQGGMCVVAGWYESHLKCESDLQNLFKNMYHCLCTKCTCKRSLHILIFQSCVFFLIVCARGGILIFDQMSSRLVQRISFQVDGESRFSRDGNFGYLATTLVHS